MGSGIRRKKNQSPSRSSLFQYLPGECQKGQLLLALVSNSPILHPHEQGPDSAFLGRLITWQLPNQYLKNILSGWEAHLWGRRQQGLLLLGNKEALEFSTQAHLPPPTAETAQPRWFYAQENGNWKQSQATGIAPQDIHPAQTTQTALSVTPDLCLRRQTMV